MTTFADLKTRVADELDRQDLSTQIDRELRKAVNHYERQRWWFNEEQATASTVASQANYSVPTDLMSLELVEITISTRRLELNEISWSRYVEDWRELTTTGQPSDWAYYADQIWLGAIPNDVYTLTLHYTKTLGSLSDGSDNAWTNFGEDLITSRTLKTLGARVLGLDTTQLKTWQELERQAYLSLCGLNDERLMTGRVRPW